MTLSCFSTKLLLCLGLFAILPFLGFAEEDPEKQQHDYFQQYTALRMAFIQDRLKMEESLKELSAEERRARMKQWRNDNVDIRREMRHLAIELAPRSVAPSERSAEDWQARLTNLPPKPRQFLELRQEIRSRTNVESSDSEREELAEKRLQLRRLAAELGLDTVPVSTGRSELILPTSLSAGLVSAFELHRDLAIERRELEETLAGAGASEREAVFQQWREEIATRRVEMRALLESTR